jgi:hypothetical protein
MLSNWIDSVDLIKMPVMSVVIASGNLILEFEIINHFLFVKFTCCFVASIRTKILNNVIAYLTY